MADLIRPPRRDLLLAFGFSLAAVAEVALSGHGKPVDMHVPLAALSMKQQYLRSHPADGLPGGSAAPDPLTLAGLSLLLTVPVAWRRRLPLAVFAVQIGAVFLVRDGVTWATFLAVLTCAYSVALYGRRPVLSFTVLTAASAVIAANFSDTAPPLPSWATPFALLLPLGLFGALLRAARARAHATTQRAEALQREHAAATQAAVASERARIARELHDVVSHHVSVMTVQAGAAGRVLTSRPDLARGALEAIETSGRDAMGELRHLLGLLTPATAGEEPGAELPLRPQPGLDQIDALVDKVRAAGQPVTAHVNRLALPQGIDLTAYRVVQEALTNAMRYAPGARTEVVIDRDADDLIVEVVDNGSSGRAGAIGAGSGLLGLAERVRVYHGTLEAGRRLGGGFRVRARMPLGVPR